MMPTIALTGASGFVGRRVLRSLASSGYDVRVLTRASTSADFPAADVRPVDFANERQLDEALRGAGTLIHLAGRAHVRKDAGDPYPLYRASNVSLSEALATSARRSGVTHVIFASSLKVYGELEHIGPATPTSPIDAYGVSKLEAEQAIRDIVSGSGCRFTAIRFPLLYGPGVKGNVRRLFDAVARGRPLPMGGLSAPRSMLGLTNLETLIDGLLSPGWEGGVCIPSDDEDVSPEQLVTLIGEALGRRARLIPAPLALLRAAGRIGDLISRWLPSPVTTPDVHRLTMASQVDSSATWAAVRRVPGQSVRQELALTAEWYRSLTTQG